MIEIDPDLRAYLVPKFNLDNPDDHLAHKAFAFFASRWVDYLARISDDNKGQDGKAFYQKWKQNRVIQDWDEPHWSKSAIESYSALALEKLPTFNKDDFIICVKLHDDYVVD